MHDESRVPESERILAQLRDIRRVVAANAERLAKTGGWPGWIKPDSILERIPDAADDVAPGFDAGIACTLDLIPRDKQELSARLHANYDKDAVMKIRDEIASLDPNSETAWWLAACYVCGTEEQANGAQFLAQIEQFKQIAKDENERLRVARAEIDHIRSSFTLKYGVPFGTKDGCIQGAYVAGYPFGSSYSEGYGIYFIGTYEDSLGLEDFPWSDEKDEKDRPKSGPVFGSKQFVKCANEDEWRRAIAVVQQKLSA